METSRSFKDIIGADDAIQQLRTYLQQHSGPHAILFVDLCDSTKLKVEHPQEEWLPIVCRFLLTASVAVEREDGRVVKYIGDEVFAVFPDQGSGLAAARAEMCAIGCESELAKLGSPYTAKYALDYGDGASVEFPGAPSDVLGTCIDRCARISQVAKKHALVASEAFVEESKHRTSWRRIGRFPFKGLPREVNVFQLENHGENILVADAKLYAQSADDLVKRVETLSSEVDECRKELRRLRAK